MKKAFKSTVLSVCLLLIAATGILITMPITTFAAVCSVSCANGSTINCAGTSCSIPDGNSCWGSTTGVRRCSSGHGPGELLP